MQEIKDRLLSLGDELGDITEESVAYIVTETGLTEDDLANLDDFSFSQVICGEHEYE